jgi:hypothetical protein
MIYISQYALNLSALPVLTEDAFKNYPDIKPHTKLTEASSTDYVVAWGDPINKCKYGVMETGFFWDAVHIDTIGLYSSCSLNYPLAIEEMKKFKAVKSAQDIVFNSGMPMSKYKQPSSDTRWEGIVLALQNPTDRSIHRGSSTDHYYKFVEDACRYYGKHLYLKLHPWNKDNVEKRFQELATTYGCSIGRAGHSLLENCKFVLVYNSTFGVDAFIREVPVVQYAPGYFWQTGAVTYSAGEFADSPEDTVAQGIKLCDFMVWKYLIYQQMPIPYWADLLRDFQKKTCLFPLKEEYSYAACCEKGVGGS